MPAFSFEKIAPPVRPTSAAQPKTDDAKPRGMISQMLDRLSDSRVKKAPPQDGAHARFPSTSAD
ncbi:hypothetical protein D4Q52_25745 [Rhodopseudomonas palustris]|uniref:Uncharacterized protein n=2 Tax=Rhodopseudomonas palustris TaxID=1076 RepID=A0A418UWU4_RHOPL|nr:hypothetical protein [Rhodopseudomonas palustris]RJF63578.1 hypothetical protein D4Q52_25745 [Rhodopseudomonas palustris]